MSHPAKYAADREIRDLRNELRLTDLRLREADHRRQDELRQAGNASVDRRFHAAETAIQDAVASAERAAIHAETNVEKRFDAVNDKIDALTKAITARIEFLSSASDIGQGRRSGQLDQRTFLFALIGMVLSAIVAIGFIVGLHL